MHEPLLARAVLPEPPRVFRVQLGIYTLGHELHLWRRSSPLLTLSWGELQALPAERKEIVALQAAGVCSRDFAGNSRPITNLRLWSRFARWCPLDTALRSLWTYLVDAHEEFKAEIPQRPGLQSRFLGTPRLWRLYRLVNDTVPARDIEFYSRTSHPTAWDYPLQLAALHEQAMLEDENLLQIYSWRDEQHDKLVAEMEAAEKAGKLTPLAPIIPNAPPPA